MFVRFLFLFALAFSFVAESSEAQSLTQLTRAYPDSACSSCAEWNEPQEPFRIFGDTYYVGTHGLASLLITSPEGHILIDGALPNSAPLILDNVRQLGFDPEEIKLVLNSHAHFDHAGGLAAIQQATGARVAASPPSTSVLEHGKSGPDDPQYGILLEFPPVENVDTFTPGDTLRVGNLQVISHATAGHTPGGTTWSWRECEGNECRHIVYADSQSPISADGFSFSSSDTYPAAISDFERGFEVLEALPCDIMITTHPSATSMWEKMGDGPEGLVDPNACRKYAEVARGMLRQRLEREKLEAEH